MNKLDKSMYFTSEKNIIENNIQYRVVKYTNGDVHYYFNGKLHRENGPAIEGSQYKVWYKHGKHHREDGPAVIYSSRRKEYWLNDKLYGQIRTDDEWIIFNII
jgi:hypothetical protein